MTARLYVITLGHSPDHLSGRPPAHQTTYDDNRRPVG